MEWSLAKSMCEGKTDPIGAELMLPSLDQWKTMFEGNGNNNALFSGLDALLGAAGGKGSKLVHDYYWSSEHDGGYANYVELFNGNAPSSSSVRTTAAESVPASLFNLFIH